MKTVITHHFGICPMIAFGWKVDLYFQDKHGFDGWQRQVFFLCFRWTYAEMNVRETLGSYKKTATEKWEEKFEQIVGRKPIPKTTEKFSQVENSERPTLPKERPVKKYKHGNKPK